MGEYCSPEAWAKRGLSRKGYGACLALRTHTHTVHSMLLYISLQIGKIEIDISHGEGFTTRGECTLDTSAEQHTCGPQRLWPEEPCGPLSREVQSRAYCFGTCSRYTAADRSIILNWKIEHIVHFMLLYSAYKHQPPNWEN